MFDLHSHAENSSSSPQASVARPAFNDTGRPPAGPARLANWGALAFDLALVALIFAGLFFRFSWVNWNQDTDLHPDEYGLTGTISRLAIPKSIGDYFNTRLSRMSPYQKYDVEGNPLPDGPESPMPDNRMRWGQWPLTIIRWAAEATDNTSYGSLRLLGRRLSALADTLALIVLYFIGRRLYNRRIALLGVALSALAVMQIQQSHFMTADNFAVLFTTLALYCAVRVAQTPTSPHPRTSESKTYGGMGVWVWYALFGVFCGMAVASRINLVVLFGMILVAALIAHADDWQKGKADLVAIGMRLALAGVATLIIFRMAQPMSFRAEKGDTTIFTIRPNPEWVDSMKVAQAESSGVGGGPPGEQWTNRPMLVFPFVNIVLWGMGLPLGLTAWAGFAWAAWRAAKTKDEWKAHLLPLVWVGGLFLFMGTRWVMSIRYFLPIYPFLALFAAWGLYELWDVVKARERRRKAEGESPFLSPSSLLLRITGAAFFAVVVGGTFLWAWGFTNAYRSENTRIQAAKWMYRNIPGPINLKLETSDGAYTDPLPMPDGTQLFADPPYPLMFRPKVSGTLTGLTLAHARAASQGTTPSDLSPTSVRLVLATDPQGAQPLAEATIRLDTASTDPLGKAYAASLSPVPVDQGQTYYLLITAPEGGPVTLSGSVVSNESWDESLPPRGVEGRDPFGGLYRGVTMEVRWGDDENKRQMFLQNLAQVDYIFLQSQRGLWTPTRLPLTYPMLREYYKALFDGRLGFDLVAQFQSPFVIGPLQVSDLVGTAAWGRPPDVPVSRKEPFNDSQLAAEEAFSVYDHAPVWIFKKRADFSLENAQALLNAIDLTQVVNQGPRQATRAPTLLMLPKNLLELQRAGGTWRAMFNPGDLLNRYEPLGVLAWWLAMLVMGWLAFPLTYLVFGGLADRGYPLAKSVALLFVAWLVWMLGSYEILPFTRGTIALGFLVLALISGVVFWFRRLEIGDYLRSHRRHILIVEGLTLALFVFDLFIRLGNPDLWHPGFGGEKPMVFSFFNAVLKSTYFPPYDPWLAGGYINYYYYGFVIVALLTKLLGIVPAFAYNLILPMLFSLLGVNAFCVAYNLVKARGENPKSQDPNPNTQYSIHNSPHNTLGITLTAQNGNPALHETILTTQTLEWPTEVVQSANTAPATEVETPTPLSGAQAVSYLPSLTLTPNSNSSPVTRHLSPYIAGIAAALLIVVLGSLGQVWVVNRAFQKAADPEVLANLDPKDYGFTTTLNGLWRVMTGQAALSIGTGNWYWDATRIVTYSIQDKGEASGNEINEFPFFTFLYADLHAHMMDLPFTILALAWGVAYVLGIQRRRSRLESVTLWFVGGLALGVARPTNTWDFPTYLALGVAAVAAAHWLRDPRITRANLFAVGGRLVLLVGLAMALYRPFDQWFLSPYSEAVQWKGPKTPLDAYLYMYGLFFFILVSFLVWEARRWLAETPATVLTEAADWLLPVALMPLALVIAIGVFLYLKIAVAVSALPLMAWAGLLLLRSRAAMSPEKRIVLFLTGTALAITLFVEVYAVGGDRMNTVFKLGMQVWTLFSVGAGAALGWVWAERPAWTPNWRGAWTLVLIILAGSAAFYTVTAANAKVRDRFPSSTAQPYGTQSAYCQEIPGVPMPYPGNRSLPVDEQPHSLNGMDYLRWSAYCDNTYFLPLKYDYDAIHWMQDNVKGSPVIVEAQSFALYKTTSRYAWNTGLPDVVGWDWHQRQERGALPTQFISERGAKVSLFYCIGAAFGPQDLERYQACAGTLSYYQEAGSLLENPGQAEDYALRFIREYDARYIIVGPMERAYYPPEGLAKFDTLVARGLLTVAYHNPGVTIYEVTSALAGQ